MWVSFVQLFLTNMLSLEFVLGFCHEIAKGGDCKVEFYQPSCWFYSVPNLLVFSQVVTLYLGGNHVRVVCKRMWRKAYVHSARPHDWISRLVAAGKSPKEAHVWSMQRSWTIMPAIALQDKKSRLAIQLARGLDSRHSQVTRPSINTPYTHEI